MKRRISVCILIMVFTLGVVCGCSSSELENNEVALCYEDLSDEAKEVFDAVSSNTEAGKLLKYKTDKKWARFTLKEKTKDDWKKIESKKLRIDPEGYLYVTHEGGVSDRTIKIRTKQVVIEKDDREIHCKDQIVLKKKINWSSLIPIGANNEEDTKTFNVEKESAIILYHNKNGFKVAKKLEDSADRGSYALFLCFE